MCRMEPTCSFRLFFFTVSSTSSIADLDILKSLPTNDYFKTTPSDDWSSSGFMLSGNNNKFTFDGRWHTQEFTEYSPTTKGSGQSQHWTH
ncbi:hypothetical protein BCR42DRAFT_429196 [Absidia repens]|uniref:Uncharacterized protein n=1 Tax=Absidia repens TaxID=90262 RepID=A0A1X2HXC6_9FUNG|nr:hypothetical protein BCR42DRAFT_429196 [Absidia repens]